jgi:hypothetical protein
MRRFFVVVACLGVAVGMLATNASAQQPTFEILSIAQIDRKRPENSGLLKEVPVDVPDALVSSWYGGGDTRRRPLRGPASSRGQSRPPTSSTTVFRSVMSSIV